MATTHKNRAIQAAKALNANAATSAPTITQQAPAISPSPLSLAEQLLQIQAQLLAQKTGDPGRYYGEVLLPKILTATTVLANKPGPQKDSADEARIRKVASVTNGLELESEYRNAILNLFAISTGDNRYLTLKGGTTAATAVKLDPLAAVVITGRKPGGRSTTNDYPYNTVLVHIHDGYFINPARRNNAAKIIGKKESLSQFHFRPATEEEVMKFFYENVALTPLTFLDSLVNSDFVSALKLAK